jgi:hypothetical protein
LFGGAGLMMVAKGTAAGNRCKYNFVFLFGVPFPATCLPT